MILIFAAIQLFGIGILGEYIGRLFEGDQATAAVSGGRHDKLSRPARLLFPASAAAGTPPEPLTGLLCQLEDPDRCEVSKPGVPGAATPCRPVGQVRQEIPHRREEVERAGRHQHERRPPAREPRPEFLQLRVGGGRSNGETSSAWYGIKLLIHRMSFRFHTGSWCPPPGFRDAPDLPGRLRVIVKMVQDRDAEDDVDRASGTGTS